MSSKNRLTRTRAPRRHRRRKIACVAPLAVIALGVAAILPASSGAAAAVGLGTATSFAVLGGSAITNTGPTTITGNIGSFPTPTETGLGTVTLHGVDHGGDAVTQQAKIDLTTAYGTAAGSGPPIAHATELGGSTLTPGVYNSPTFGITGTLTLNTLGNPNAVFVFQTASTLITASNSSVIVLGGGTACNVFWQIGSSATLGTGSALIGNVLAATSITATTGATIQGRLLAETGAVTLDTNTITRPVCSAAATTTVASGATTTASGGTTTTASGGTTTVPGGGSGTPTSTTVPGTPAPGTPGSGTPGTPGSGTPTPSLPHTL